MKLWVGTYTEDILFGTGKVLHGKGEGIYRLTLDPTSLRVDDIVVNKGIKNPSFLTVSADKKYLFAVNELKEYLGKASGAVSSFHIDEESGSLEFISSQPTLGTDPCHVTVNHNGTLLFVANFMSGSVSVFPVDSNGGILPAREHIQHKGGSVCPNRQAGPHAHAVVLSPDERFLFVPDLGIDKVLVYSINYSSFSLEICENLAVECISGSGPRQLVFHDYLPYAFLINELNSTIDTFTYASQEGKLSRTGSFSTLPSEFSGVSTCADIHISSCGKYLFGSNRGHDSIVTYEIDGDSGLLNCKEFTSVKGRCPRNFLVKENHILIGNQDSDAVEVFSFNDGHLEHTGMQVSVPTPVCIIECD